MDHQGAVNKLCEIEQDIDVNAFLFRGVHIWPLARQLLWFWLCRPHLHQHKHSNGIFTPTSLKLSKETINSLKFLKNNVDAVFLCRKSDYQLKIKDKHYNRFADPFIESFQEETKFLKLEFITEQNNILRHQYIESFQIIVEQKNYIHKYNNLYRVENFDKLNKVINKVCGDTLDEILLAERLHLALQYAGIFRQTLPEINPKSAFVACYLDPLGMGLCHACNLLNITSVDYQHGKQGRYNGMYTHWKNIPDTGYAHLPDWFWTWGNESNHNIEKWLPQSRHRHHAIIGGNLWLSRWQRGLYPEDAAVQELREIINNRVVILVSLQDIPDTIPQFLEEAILKSPIDWVWLMRSHPLHKHKNEKQITQLQKIKPGKIEHKICSEIHLLDALKMTSHHITAFSSVCYEAASLKIGTTIIHKSGKILYEREIKSKMFYYAESFEEILSSIANALRNNTSNATDYIETDIQISKNALKTIMCRNRST